MHCPICFSNRLEALLSLRAPLYQHPQNSYIEQVTQTLDYAICFECGHSFRPSYDFGKLSKIYEEKYYTPCSESTSKDVFFAEAYAELLSKHTRTKNLSCFLEIGCSMGRALQLVSERNPGAVFVGVDPDKNNIQSAVSTLSSSTKQFFVGFFPSAPPASAISNFESLHIYSRHVIEHVPDPRQIIASMRQLPAACSVTIETPCSNFYIQSNASLDPFHVEHLHVFSRRSARILLEGCQDLLETCNSFGDIILTGFLPVDRETCVAISAEGLSSESHKNYNEIAKVRQILQRDLTVRAQATEKVIQATSDYIFWGCGSKCANLLGLGMEPIALFDGNPQKSGMYMPGYKVPIQHVTREALLQYRSCVLVISTSFADGVVAAIKEMGICFRDVVVM